MSVLERYKSGQTAARNATAGFVLADNYTTTALKGFFNSLPEIYRKRAVVNIYTKVLRKMRADMVARILSNAEQGGRGPTGALAGMIKVTTLRPIKNSKDPAAMVHLSHKRQRGSTSLKTRKTTWRGQVAYGYALEYGTADRKRKSDKKYHVFTQHGGWVTAGSSTGAIPRNKYAYFRPIVDKYRSIAQSEVMAALEKYGEKELQKQIKSFNNKTQKGIKVTL